MSLKSVRSAILIWIAVGLALAGCGAASTATPSPTAPASTGTWEQIEFTSEALAGNLLRDPATRTIRIYLPPGYEASDQRYPVVYALHGYLENPTWLRGMGLTMNDLVAEGEAQGMILVFPDGDNAFGGSHYLSSPVIEDYETYIARELVDYIDRQYRTLATREARGIAGCSMGANGAMHLAFTYPEAFSVVAGASGGYAYETYPQWDQALETYSDVLHPSELADIPSLPWYIRVFFAYAAGIAPNPADQVFHFDLPFVLEGAEGKINQQVYERIREANVYQDVLDYLQGPYRLSGISLYQGIRDDLIPHEMPAYFSAFLTEQGIQHEFVEVEHGHCDPTWDYSDLLIFMSGHLMDG
jgi:pimeloyl-ACP methyl ester carboxylesterase